MTESLERGVRALGWAELLAHSRQCKLEAKTGSGSAASWSSLLIRGREDGSARLYGLGVADPAAGDLTLLYADIPAGGAPPEIAWAPLLDTSTAGPGKSSTDHTPSREEEMRRERMRCKFRGITALSLHSATGTLLFQTESGCFTAVDTLETGVGGGVVPRPLGVPVGLTVVDPVPCPAAPELVAFVHRGDVHVVIGEIYARVSQLADHAATPPFLRYAGSPSFVIQEEFDRYSGMWWSPKVQPDGTYLLLMEEVDEREVSESVFQCPGGRGSEAERMRYPLTGATNAVSSLRLARIEVLRSSEGNPALLNISLASLPMSLPRLFPFFEYLPRAGWLPDGSAVWLQLMSRTQERLVLAHVPVTAFEKDAPLSTSMTDLSSQAKLPAPITILVDEQRDQWINFNDLLEFIPNTGEGEVQFLWGSERTGYDHYYHIKVSLAPKNYTQSVMSQAQRTEVQVTQGEWPIRRKVRPIFDHKKKLIYFSGLKDSPVESHIYVVSYGEPELGVHRLTEMGKSACSSRAIKSLAVEPDTGLIAVTESSVSTPPAGRLYRLSHGPPPSLPTAQPLAYLAPPVPPPPGPSQPVEAAKEDTLPAVFSVAPPFPLDDQRPPTLFPYQSKRTGLTHYAFLFLPPPSFPLQKNLPVVQYVYGGPEVQLVKNQWSSAMGMLKYTSLGYAVVMVDGRGSSNRGFGFESLVGKAMGQEEIGDQVEGLEAVSEAAGPGVLDMSRVAIAGWSYGGYLVLFALIHRPEVYKVGLAGGPVTDWALYDTGYTERYMGLPTAAPLAYRAGSVLAAAERLPSQPGRLLLAHGFQDENVHFMHTLKLIQRLVTLGKPYQLAIFPGERHGISAPAASDHLDATMLHFLRLNL